MNKFIDKEPNLNRIKEILCSNKIYNIFATYLNTTLKTDYDTEINKILERVFIYKLQSSHHGITVISNIIVIDSSSPFKNQELDSAYRSGYQVEKSLFGKRVNILHTEGAKFLMVAKN